MRPGLSHADADRFRPERLRHLFGHFATGVTVVTAISAGQPIGMACNSFASTSLDPPLVSFAVGRSSETWPRIRAAGSFAINILALHQHRLGRAFARKDVDRFAAVPWDESPSGNPLIRDSLAWLDCSLERVHAAGDHELVLARVRWLEASRGGEPLVFFAGLFAGIDRSVAPAAGAKAPPSDVGAAWGRG